VTLYEIWPNSVELSQVGPDRNLAQPVLDKI